MNLRFRRTGIAAAVALAAGMLALPAFAQQSAAQAPAANAPAASAPQANTGPAPTEAELQHFAHAATDVMSIRQATEPKLSAAKDAAARTQLEQGAQQQMEAAVRSHHLTVARYEQIAMVVQSNQQVREKVMHLMSPAPPQAS